MSCSRRIKTIVRKSDMYGVPIGLRYKSGNTFQTFIGGSFTIFSRIAILCFLIYGLRDVYYKKNSIVKKTLYRDMFVDKSRLHLTKENFDVGITVSFLGDATDAQENLFRYMEFVFFNQGVSYENGDFTPVTSQTNFSKCGNDRFGGDQSVIQSMSLADYFCASAMDTEIYGGQTGESNQYGIFIKQCNNDTLGEKGENYTCATQEQIDEVFDMAIAQIVVMSSYFDAFEFDTNPIKKQYRTYIYSLDHNLGQGQDIYIQENQLTTFDSQVGSFFGGQDHTYLDTVLGKTYTGSVKPDVLPQLGIYFMLSPWIDSTTRQVRSVMDCLTETGGFSNVIGLIAKLSILKLQQQLFYESLIKKMFKVQQKNNRSSSRSKISQQNQVNTPFEKLEKLTQRNGIKKISQYLAYSIPERIAPQINILKQRIMKICCFCKQSCSNHDKNPEKIIFDNALSMLDTQFDIVKMMKSVRSSHLLQKLILSKSQRALIPYFKDNIISTKNSQPHKKGEKSKVVDMGRAKKMMAFDDQNQLKRTVKKMLLNAKESKVNYKILKELINSDDEGIDVNIIETLKKIPVQKHKAKTSVKDSNIIVKPFEQIVEIPPKLPYSTRAIKLLGGKVPDEEIDSLTFVEDANTSGRQLMLQPISQRDPANIKDLQGKTRKAKNSNKNRVKITEDKDDKKKQGKNKQKIIQQQEKLSLDFQ